MMFFVRFLEKHETELLSLVVTRMALTLDEVVGRPLYTRAWLEDRLYSHLDGRLPGRVFGAFSQEGFVGHTIVRLEDGYGLFSTTYVVEEFRGQGVARQLLRTGEDWLRLQGCRDYRTNTAPHNWKLQKLYQSEGYTLTPVNEEFVQLRKLS